jgi:hypothetical protein
MILDRSYQLELLQKLAGSYPSHLPDHDLDEKLQGTERQRYVTNMHYLEEHGLVDGGLQLMSNGAYSLLPPAITARSIDFLLDDGGLSAILGTVTIKIHDETLKELVALRIAGSGLEPKDKLRWTAALQSLPAESTKHLAMKLVDLGLTRAPEALHVIETYLAQFLK